MEAHPPPIGTETLHYLWRKFKKLIPYVIIGFVIGILSICIVKDYGLLQVLTLTVYALPQLFLISESGIYIDSTMPNVVIWYLSAMFIAMLIIYPLLRKNTNFFIHVLAPIIFLLTIGYLCVTYGHLNLWVQWTGFTSAGLIRAIGEISLGCFGYALCQKLSQVSFGILGKAILSLIAICGYLVVIVKAFGSIDAFSYMALLLLFVSVVITFSNQGMLSHAFKNKSFTRLADLTMVLFLCQCSIRVLFTSGMLFGDFDPVIKFVAYCVSSIVLAVIIYILVTYMKKVWRVLPAKYKSVFWE